MYKHLLEKVNFITRQISEENQARKVLEAFNPFAPEPPVTNHADPCPFYRLCFLTVKDNFVR